MKKIFKFAWKTVAVLLVLGIVVAHGWRLGGFLFCAAPESMRISHVEIKDDVLIVWGAVDLLPTSFISDRFQGYTVKQKGSTVTVGIKKRATIRTYDPGVSLEIPIKAPVEKVVLSGANSEMVVYPSQESEIQ